MVSSTTTTELTSHISTLLESYISAFNAGDLAAAASYYDEPAVVISAGSGVTLLPARKDYVDTFAETMKRLKAEGWVRSEFVGEKSIVTLVDGGDDAGKGKGLVVASCPCKRLRGDGSSVEEFTAIYTLRRADGEGWVICSIHHGEFGRVLKA